MPHCSQETERRLPEWDSVYMEVWEDGGDDVSHPGLRRLGARQRQLPHTPKVGLEEGAGTVSFVVVTSTGSSWGLQPPTPHFQGGVRELIKPPSSSSKNTENQNFVFRHI